MFLTFSYILTDLKIVLQSPRCNVIGKAKNENILMLIFVPSFCFPSCQTLLHKYMFRLACSTLYYVASNNVRLLAKQRLCL